jgi:hypothetical protein
MSKTIDATSDERVANNAMRHAYRILSDEEKARMARIKDLGAALLAELHAAGETDPAMDRLGSRELAIAAQRTEEAVMWAVKHVTK